MSKEVDQKVVEMRFDNRQFEQNVKTTMSTLDRLKAALNFKGSVQGLESINNASKHNNVGLIGQAADAVRVKFSTMEIVAMTALSNITNSVLNTGKHILNSLTFEPVMSGFKEYETQINAVQTILANTSMDGTGIEDVNAALDELNLYADKTIYNFTEMTRNIGTFTAAGVKLDTSVQAIKGIANLAALSGSNSQQASTAMYQLSQALAAGRVSLQDWNSVVNAGMGGKVFQNALMDTAEAMGIVVDRTQSFRESLSTVGGKKSWLTSEVLLNTLRQFTGDLTDAELAQMGFNKAQIETIQNMAFTANEAATRVKTATQLYDTLKESVQSGWTQTWKLIFGDFEEAKVFFTGISNILGDFFSQSAEARNSFLSAIVDTPWDSLSKKLEEAGVDIEDFQNRAWSAAKEAGKVSDELMKNAGSFEATLQNGWLTSDIVTKVLREYAGATTEVGKATEDMNQKLSKFQKIVDDVWAGKYKTGKERQEALTKAGYDYAEVQELVNKTINGHKLTLEDLSVTQAKSLGFTEDEIAMLNDLADAAEKTGTPINELINNLSRPVNGRTLFFNSLTNIVQAFVKLLSTVKSAFAEAFSINPTSIYNALSSFEKFTRGLILSDESAGKLKNTLKGILALFDILRRLIVSGVNKAFTLFSNILKKFKLPIGDFTSGIGEAIIAVHDWVVESEIIPNTFDRISNVILDCVDRLKEWSDSLKLMDAAKRVFSNLSKSVGSFKTFFQNAFTGMDNLAVQFMNKMRDVFISGFNAITNALKSFKENVLDKVFNFDEKIQNAKDSFAELKESVKQNTEDIGDSLTSIGEGIKIFIDLIRKFIGDNVSLADLMAVLLGYGTVKALKQLNTAITGITKAITDLVSPASSFSSSLKTISSSISSTLGALSNSFKADVLVKQATAIGILAASVAVLALLPQDKLIGAVGAVMALLLAFYAFNFGFTKLAAIKETKMTGVALMFLSMAAAVGIMVGALAALKKVMGPVEGEEGKGSMKGPIGALAGIVIGMVAVAKILSDNSREFMQNSGGLIMFAIAVRVLVSSLETIANDINPERLWSAVFALSTLLGVMAVISNLLMPGGSAIGVSTPFGKAMGMRQTAASAKGLLSAAAAILILSGALKVLVSTIDDIANLDTTHIENNIANFVYAFGMLATLMGVNKLFGGGGGLGGVGILGLVLSVRILIDVIKMVANIDKGMIQQATGSMVAIIGVLGLIIGMSRLAGEHAFKAGAMILLVSGAMIMLTGALAVMSHIDGERLGAATKSIATILAMFSLLVASTKLVGDAQNVILQLTITVTVLASALSVLSLLNKDSPDNLENVTNALSTVMGMFAILIAAAGTINNKALGTLAGLGIGIAAIGAIMYGIASLDSENTAPTVFAFSALMLALAVSFRILQHVAPLAGGVDKSLGVLILALAGIGAIIAAMSEFTDASAAIPIATALSELLIVLTGVTVVLSNLGASGLAAGAMAGAVALDKVILVVGGLITSIVAVASALVSQWPELETFAKGGLSLLKTIFTGVADILGSTVSSFGVGLTSGLPAIGENLSAFMDSLSGFITTVQTIDKTAFENFVSLVDAIGSIDEIKMDPKKIDDFAELMPKYADTIALFGTAVGENNINTEAVKTAAEAGKAIAEMATAIPNSGGIIADWLTGDNDLGDFSTKMFNFGLALNRFAFVTKNLDTAAVEKAVAAGDMMVGLSKKIPNEGGLLARIVGDNDLATWSIKLPIFGKAMVFFANSVKNLDTAAVEKAATAADMMIELAKEVPNEGGLIEKIVGSNNLDTFGGNLESFGTSLAKFAASIVDLDLTSVERAKIATGMMIELSKTIPETGGILDKLFGTSNFSTFGDNIADFGEGLGKYYDAVKDLDAQILTDSITAASDLVYAANWIPQVDVGGTTLAGFAYMLKTLGDNMEDYYESIEDINPDTMGAITAKLSGLVDVANSMTGLDPKAVESFGVAMSQLGSSLSGSFTDAIEGASAMVGESVLYLLTTFAMAVKINTFKGVEAFNQFASACLLALNIQQTNFSTTGSTFAEKIIEGFKSKTSAVTNAGVKLIGDALTAIKKKHGEFVTAGDYLAQGVADGLSSSAAIQRICDAARALVRAAIEAAEEEADINSPSRVMMQDGLYMAEGFGNGMVKGIRIVSGSARKMSKSAIDVVSESVNRLSDLITKDIDTTPVIRPILDLSGARKEALKLNSLFIEDQALKINSSVNRNKTSPVENQNGEKKESTVEQFNFTQNNYSPKALSRKEIYRQTRNQFAMAKGVVSRT